MEAAINSKVLLVELRARAIIAQAAYEIQTTAQQLCPVDTGYLQSTIDIDYRDDGLGAQVVVRAFYAPFVELGTGRRGSQRNLFSGVLPPGWVYGSSGGQAAQPFLYPAFVSVEADFAARLQALVDEVTR